MLSRKHRFHGRRSLQAIYRHGKITRGELFSVKVLENPRREKYRCAIVVSKKVSKSAVVRNKIRRRIYEQIRQQVNPNTPRDIMIVVYDEKLATMPAADLDKELSGQLKAAKLIISKPTGLGRDIINKKEN